MRSRSSRSALRVASVIGRTWAVPSARGEPPAQVLRVFERKGAEAEAAEGGEGVDGLEGFAVVDGDVRAIPSGLSDYQLVLEASLLGFPPGI